MDSPDPVRPAQGLASAEAAARLARHGPNALTAREQRGLGRTVLAVVTEPIFGLLLAAAAVYLLLGDLGEGLLLSAFAVLSVGLVVMQERRSARALDALRELAAPQVRVLRDGRLCRLPARELVPGDWVLVGEGERVPADAVLREADGLSVDESLLTGESAPVRKQAQAHGTRSLAQDEASGSTGGAAAAWPGLADVSQAGIPAPGGDGLPWLYASTLVVAGRGVAEVLATGEATRVGQIGASLAAIEHQATPLEQHLRRLVRIMAAVALALGVSLVLWHGLGNGGWLQGLLAGIALAMAMLPEEVPMVLAIFLALGAWRLARVQVLARRPAVIEALGAVTVLCVDKTGTLTENRMRVRRLVTDGLDLDLAGRSDDEPLPEPVHRLMEFAMLSSQRGGVEPMDMAILGQGEAGLADTEHLHPDWLLAREYPLTPELLAISRAWTDDAGRPWVAAKGAPEAIADLCHLDAPQVEVLRARVQALAQQGLRVLAVAEGQGRTPVAAQAHDHDFRLLGLVAFEDPLRASVPPAVAMATRAGIAVVMITGDHPGTALAIAAQAGIDTRAGALTGAHLQGMDDTALAQAMRSVRVFARVTPQDKLRLVRALRANGETVAMTGDGVNDAPALKAAHVGLAMGQRGTDVAREAASIVLLDEDFGRIVEGVALGRRIFDNLSKVMTYILAIHIPIAGLTLLPLLLGLPALMLPVHVVVTQMIIDPVCSLAFENAPPSRGSMERPPRRQGKVLLDGQLVLRAVLQGASLLAGSLAVYALAVDAGLPPDAARALAFIGLTFGNLLLVGLDVAAGLTPADLFHRQFAAYWAVAAGAVALIALALAVPGLRALLRFEVPAPQHLAIALAAVGASVLAGWALGQRVRVA